MAQNVILSPELQEIEREYGRNIRIVEARPKLERLGLLVAFVLEGCALIFSIIVLIGYVISGSFNDLRSAGSAFGSNIKNFRAIAAQSDARDLQLGAAKVVQGTPTSYDFFAPITNSNADWYATFTYAFSSSQVSSEEKEGFVMPGVDSYLLALGMDSENRPGSVSISVNNIVWHRVNRHIALDVASWLDAHNAFVITDPTYTPDLDFGTSKIGRTTFSISNPTPYSYWNAPFTAVLERAGAIVGISQAVLTEFDAAETRESEVRWYGELPVTATATIFPAINYFDEKVYMPPRGASETDVRDSLVE